MKVPMPERWRVRARDGHEFELFAETPDRPRAALLFLSALGVEASYYRPFAEAMRDEGTLVALCDLRGNGTSNIRPRRGVDFGYREIVEHDIPSAMAAIKERAPAVPLYLGGHSLGGQLTMLHVATAKPGIAGLILVACAIPYYRSWRGKYRYLVWLASRLFPVVGFVLGYVPGKRIGFGGTEASAVMRDWSHSAASGGYALQGSVVDYEAALRELEVDFVTVNIEGDEMGPPQAVEFIFQKVPKARGRRIQASVSEPERGAHFRWARDPTDVVRAITGWLERDGRP
jgi:predicted alpha/beta hydrolase